MTVAKLTEGLNLIEAGMTVLENMDSKQSIATTRKLTLLLQRASKRNKQLN